MKAAAIAIVGVSFVGATMSVALSWQASARISKIEERVVDIESRLSSMSILDDSMYSTETSILSRLVSIEATAMPAPVAKVRAPSPTARPSAHWWCYFGRECFRSLDGCVAGDTSRQSDCRPQDEAWCSGADGRDCRASMSDCLDVQLRQSGRPCVRIE